MDGKDTSNASQFRIGFLIHDVSRLRRTVIDKALKPLGITRSQWWVLSNLSRHSNHEMKQTELASVLDVGKVALGGLLDRLEAGQYIDRRADPHDRRAKRVVMTQKGEDVLNTMQEQGRVLNMQTLQNVTPEEVQIVEKIMHKMKKRLLEMDAELKKN